MKAEKLANQGFGDGHSDSLWPKARGEGPAWQGSSERRVREHASER